MDQKLLTRNVYKKTFPTLFNNMNNAQIQEYLETIPKEDHKIGNYEQKNILTLFVNDETAFMKNLQKLDKDSMVIYTNIARAFSEFVEQKIIAEESKEMIEKQIAQLTQEKLERDQKKNEKRLKEISAKKIELAKKISEIESIKDFEPVKFPSHIVPFDIDSYIPDQSWTQREMFGKNHIKLEKLLDLGIDNVILAGNAGLGKSEAVMIYGAKHSIPVFRYASSQESSYSDLYESKTITLENNQQVVKTQYGVIAQAIQTANMTANKTAILNLEESNLLNAKQQKLLNVVSDQIRKVDLVSGTLKLKPKSRLIIILTMNYGANYAGITPLNRDLLDRFKVLTFVDLSKAEIESMVRSRYEDISSLDIELLLSYRRKYNQLIENNEITDNVEFSNRTILSICELISVGYTFREAVEIGFTNKILDETDKNKIIGAFEQ